MSDRDIPRSERGRRASRWAVSLAAALFAASVLAAPQRDRAGPQPVVSLRDIMLHEIDPAADALWESVSTELTATGTQERQPRTADEWEAVRRQALKLAEAPNLLVVPGRPVAHGGEALDDADAPGNQTAAEIERQIAGDRPGFVRLATDLQRAAMRAAAAAKARDVAALSNAGAAIDGACEACHRTFWYPGEAELLRAQGAR